METVVTTFGNLMYAYYLNMMSPINQFSIYLTSDIRIIRQIILIRCSSLEKIVINSRYIWLLTGPWCVQVL